MHPRDLDHHDRLCQMKRVYITRGLSPLTCFKAISLMGNSHLLGSIIEHLQPVPEINSWHGLCWIFCGYTSEVH